MSSWDDGIHNVQIEKTELGFEDHGFPWFCITVAYGKGSGQGFVFNDSIPEIGHAVFSIIKALDVHRWEDLKGKYCRVKTFDRKIVGIGHIVEDQWWEKDGK